eukprot:1196385-Prorocentrum_minimum.AAC.7
MMLRGLLRCDWLGDFILHVGVTRFGALCIRGGTHLCWGQQRRLLGGVTLSLVEDFGQTVVDANLRADAEACAHCICGLYAAHERGRYDFGDAEVGELLLCDFGCQGYAVLL